MSCCSHPDGKVFDIIGGPLDGAFVWLPPEMIHAGQVVFAPPAVEMGVPPFEAVPLNQRHRYEVRLKRGTIVHADRPAGGRNRTKMDPDGPTDGPKTGGRP